MRIVEGEEWDIRYKKIKIKQHKHVSYLGCVLDETILGETMAIRVIEKLNSRLKFLYRKNRFLDVPLRRLLCNVLIQPHFDYTCAAWYPNLTKKIKDKLQVTLNKCIILPEITMQGTYIKWTLPETEFAMNKLNVQAMYNIQTCSKQIPSLYEWSFQIGWKCKSKHKKYLH